MQSTIAKTAAMIFRKTAMVLFLEIGVSWLLCVASILRHMNAMVNDISDLSIDRYEYYM